MMRRRPSPNHGERRDGQRVSLVVLHYTAMATADAALERLCAPEHEVSAHYLVGRDGSVIKLVEEDRRAWHAGAGSWGGRGDVNSRSIGIELDNDGRTPFAAAQMDATEELLADVMARHGLPPQSVIGHSDMAPERKADPGPRFDWRRLAQRGLSVWPAPGVILQPPDPDRFRADAVRFGYPDLPLAPLLTAFRLRFRPWATGPLDPADMAAIADLADRYPVDPQAPAP